MRFNEKQRTVLAEKLADLGNIAAGSLVFGYVVRSDAFSGWSLVLGLIIAAGTYIFATVLLER